MATTVSSHLQARHETMPSPAGSMKRPEIHRLRSNSVPVAISLMDCTEVEAGLIFSAGERAAARRRRHQSVDDSNLSQPSSSEKVPTIRTPIIEDVLDDDMFDVTTPSTIRPAAVTPPPFEEQIQQPLASPEVVAYNQDMAHFIRDRLHELAQKYNEPQESNPAPQNEALASPQRPPLVSHFSNWSNTTESESDGADLMIELATSPPSESPAIDDKDIENGFARVVQFRSRSEMDRTSPSYFSWPKRRRPNTTSAAVNFDTPSSGELRTACEQAAPKPVTSTPALIDLDAGRSDTTQIRHSGFFDFPVPAKKDRSSFSSPGGGFHGLHIGQHQSPRPIAC